MALAAAVLWSQHSPTTAAASGKKVLVTREQSRRNRENSRRRQAALLFLSNISLDGRPVNSRSAESGRGRHHKDGEPDSDSAAGVAEPGNSNTHGAFSSSAGCRSISSPSAAQRSGLLTVPPILVLPSDTSFNEGGSAESLLECRRGSFPPPVNSNLLSPSPSNTSLLPSPVGPRKSSTLLSVQSCNSVSSEPRQR